MLFFVLFSFLSSFCQKLLIDSRVNQYNQADIEVFKNKFSIWFSIKKKSDQNSDIFQIIYKRRQIVRVASYAEQLQIFENKQLKQAIKYEQDNSFWFHIIITQYDEQQHVVFDLNVFQYSTKYSTINLNNTLAVKNETKIISNRNKNYFCLIYDSITELIPIIQKTVFYSFIMPSAIEYLLYDNCSTIVFLRKFQQQYETSGILSLHDNEQQLFTLIENQNKLYIQFDENFNELGLINEQMFTIQIEISKDNIDIIIKFIDKSHKYEIPNTQDQFFYTLLLSSTNSNFEPLQIIQIYKLKFEDIDKQLFELQCDYYRFYDRNNNKCIDQIYEIKIIQDDDELQLSNIMADDKYEQIRNLIFYKILMQLDIDDVQLFINQDIWEQNLESKDIYVLWKNNYITLCQQFYYGSNCQKFQKQCLLMSQNNCIGCMYGFVNIQQNCKKCPKDCLICNYKNHTLNCLLSLKGYYVNKKGLTQICNCNYCSQNGECLNIENIRQLIDVCLQNTLCNLKKCLPSEYFSIKSQKCITLSKVSEKILLYYIVNNDRFQYQILELQHEIIQSYNNLVTNEKFQQLYFAYQLQNKQNLLLEQANLSSSQYHLMNRYNLNCLEKMINFAGQIVCKKFVQQNNIDQNIQYQFTLELYNVSLYYEIEYQQQQYSNLTHLLQQIKDVGVEYANITIELTIKLGQGALDYDYGGQIFIDRYLLPNHVRFSQFHLFLKFPKIQNNTYFLFLEVQIDFLYIIDQFVTYQISLQIQKCLMATFRNFSMVDWIKFELIVESVQNLNFIDCMLNSKYVLVFNNIQYLKIINSDFNFIFLESIILIEKVINLIIQNSQFNSINLQNRRFLNIKLIKNIIFEDIFLNIQNTTDCNMIFVAQSNNTIFQNVVVKGNNMYKTQIIKILNSTYQILEELKIVILNSNKIMFYYSESNQVELYNCQVYGKELQQTNFFTIISDEVIIKYNTYFIEISTQNTILVIDAQLLIIDDFSYLFKLLKNQRSLNNTNVAQYNYQYQFRVDYGSISNFSISGQSLLNQGLINLHVTEQVKINNFLIENISFVQDFLQSLISFQEYKNYPMYSITNMTVRNVIPVIINDNILININNAVVIQIINITMDHIQSSMNMGYLLRTKSIQTNIYYFTISNCQGQNFMDIQSVMIKIYYLYFQNNQLYRIFDLQTFNNQFFSIENSVIQFSSLYSELIFASKSFIPSLEIIIKNMTIYQIQSYSNIFFLQGDLIYFVIYDFKMQRQNLDQLVFYEKQIFNVVYSNFFAYNLIVDNIQYSLFSFFQIQHILLSKIQILNINKFNEYYVQIVSMMMNNNSYILKILYFFQLQNVTEVITHFQLQEKQQYFNLQNLILIQFNIEYLLGFVSEYQKNLKIQNLFINQGKFHLQEGSNAKFYLINSFISDITFQYIDQDKIELESTEVIGNQLQFTNKFELKHTQIYDSVNLLRYNKIPFFMTLSFDGGISLQQIQQLNDQLQFKIKENFMFFYVPSGQKLSQYKRLNLRQLSYEQYFSLLLVVKGYNFQQNIQHLCYQQQYYNEQLIHMPNILYNFTISEEQYNIDQIFIINPHNLNYTVIKINCQFNNETISLLYNVKSFPCQLGEYFYKNQCILCNISYYQYSVTYNATKCQYIDTTKIKTLKAGLIELQQNYWRYKFDSHIIEFCESSYCNGGWIPGDKSCIKSRIGALCNECDLYNVRGDGQYTKNNGECTLCSQLNIKFVLQFLFALILQQLFAILAFNSNNNTSIQYLFYKIGFKQFYQILYRQSVDQTSIIIKMYTNYLFMLYIIRENFDIIGKLFVININFMNNPSLIFQAQLTCILSELTQLNIIYSQFFYEIFLTLLIMSITFTIYLIAVLLKKKHFSIGFIIFFMDSVFVYNVKIITETATNLLSYNWISQQKWIRLNIQYLFYSDTHIQMIKYIIPIIATIFLIPIIFPFLSKNLNIFSKKSVRIFSIYFQEYRPELFYWEYCIIYTKYIMMILQIQENKSINLELLVILFIVWTIHNFKPYYLLNLNQYEYNLFTLYIVQSNFLIQSNWVSIFIICLNIYFFFLFIKKIKQSYYLLNINKIIYYKQEIVRIFPKLNNLIKINQHLQQVSNRKLFLQITRTKIMKKQYIPQKSSNQYQLETEIELESFKQTISRIYPSRQE